MELLAAFGVLCMGFLPTAELDTWGNEKMEMLTSHYEQANCHVWKSAEGEETSVESAPVQSLTLKEQGRSVGS